MIIQHQRLTVGPLQTNCYVIWDSDTRSAAVIDPGGDADIIRGCIDYNNLTLELILLTHGHPDHCFVAGDMANDFGVEVAMHEADIVQIEQGMALAEMFYDVSGFVPFKPAKMLDNGDILTLAESQVQVMHTPGHSPGGLCFKTSVGVFCGDTIFAGSIGRTDFPGGSHHQLLMSIQTKLLSLTDSTPLYPGHGPHTTVGRERATNPFLS